MFNIKHKLNQRSPWAMRPLPLLVAFACTALGQAQAQGQMPAPVLKEVVVSGSRSEQSTEDLALQMDVLRTQDLEVGQVGDIRDMAAGLPNVSVKRAPARFGVTGRGNSVGADANAGFTIRGQGGNRVVMLVDGVRLPRSYINGSNAFGRDSVAVGLLKRVEIVHGASSVLYGSDGLAGLVNFITLEPADYLLTTDGVRKQIGGKAWLAHSGDDQGMTVGATLAARAGDAVEWSVTGTKTRADGLSNMGTNDAANGDRTTPNPQSINSEALLGKLVFRPAAGVTHRLTLEHVRKTNEVDLLSSRVKVPVALPLTYATLGTPATRSSLQTAANAAAVMGETAFKSMNRDRVTWDTRYRLDRDWADHVQLTLSAQTSHAMDDGKTLLKTAFANDGARTRTTQYDERAVQGSVQFDKVFVMTPRWSQKLTYGVDLTRTDTSSLADGSDPLPLAAFAPRRYFPDTRDSSQAVYVQSEWISDQWSVTPGIRYDRFALDVQSQAGYFPGIASAPGTSLSGTALTPKLGVMFRATPQWSLYASYATGFRAPEGQQVNSALEVSTAVLLPNPDLKQETSRSFEIGTHASMGRLSVDAALFSSKYNQLIVEKKDLGTANGLPASTANKTRFQTVNIDKATISGFEVRGDWDWGRVAEGKLSTPFSYGSIRGSNDTSNQPLNTIDPAKYSVGIKFEGATWLMRLDAVHREEKSVQDLDSVFIPKSTTQLQFLVPAATTLDFSSQWRLRKDVRLNLAVNNLTDRKYWNWSDVQGLASNAKPMVMDAYTQPGRHVNVSLVVDF